MRLTGALAKDGNGKAIRYVAIPFTRENEIQIVQKLGLLEDIEDELGIDLITYFKVRKFPYVYFKLKGRVYTGKVDRIIQKGVFISYGKKSRFFRFVDFGKTWTLKMEELESKNENDLL